MKYNLFRQTIKVIRHIFKGSYGLLYSNQFSIEELIFSEIKKHTS